MTGTGVPAPGGDGLAIAVCLAVGDLRPAVDLLTGAVTESEAGIGLSAPDATALETALRLAGAGGRVTALAVGPPSIDPVLAELAGLGISVVRVPDGPVASHDGASGGAGRAAGGDSAVDERTLARVLTAVADRHGPFDLVICGDRSSHRGTGALPAFLAHELGVAQALGLVELGPATADETRGDAGVPRSGSTLRALRAVRRLDAGWREHLDVPLPAVCSVEGGMRLRRAPLAGALRAAETTVSVEAANVVPGPTAGADVRVGRPRPFRPPAHRLPAPTADDPRLRLLALTGALDTPEPPVVIGPLTPDAAADRLLAFVERHRERGGTSVGA